MEDRNLTPVHQFLNKEIDLDELQKRLSEEDFEYWKSTLFLVDELPKAPFNTDVEFKLLQEKRTSRKSTPWRFRWAAAAVFLVFSSLMVYNFLDTPPEVTTLSYQSDLKETIIYLPDSSKVWLNKGATLSYSAAQWDELREVTLEGAAYFEVKKGATFTVHSPLGSVQVLGTTFSVVTQKDLFAVTCFSGKVAVHHDNKEIILEARDAYSSQTREVTQVTTLFPEFVRPWTLFEKAPLTDIIQDLEKRKQLLIDISVDKDYLFTGGYSYDMTTEEILDLISQSLGIRFRKIDTNHYELYTAPSP